MRFFNRNNSWVTRSNLSIPFKTSPFKLFMRVSFWKYFELKLLSIRSHGIFVKHACARCSVVLVTKIMRKTFYSNLLHTFLLGHNWSDRGMFGKFGSEAVWRRPQGFQPVIIGKLSRCHPICTRLATRCSHVICQINMSTPASHH